MKSKIFIGSSVEGLNVAYAIQQNLHHVAESTVWDQGIFELSLTTIESLINVVERSDFGIFVFSPDDLTIMRGEKNKTVRDNVIFEFGLFIGKLGRERVFFITPDGHDFHLPTDLIGITPGKYDPAREDGSLLAATGPACNLIRQLIKKLPHLTNQKRENESNVEVKVNEYDWLDELSNNNFSKAKEKLKDGIGKKEGEILAIDETWLAFIDFKEDAVTGLTTLLNIAKSKKEYPAVLELVAQMLISEHYSDAAHEILDFALKLHPENPNLIILKAECFIGQGELEKAIFILSKCELQKIPEVSIALAEIYEKKDDLDKAIESIHLSYAKYPSAKNILYKYARLLQAKDRHEEALYLLNYLSVEDPKNTTYWGYLSNTCLQLNLYDKAMYCCKKALELSKGEDAWILHNIGNIFKNKGFYSEAETWLNKGLELDPQSEYAHDRLSQSIKERLKEQELFSELCKNGRIALQNNSQ